MILVLGMGCRRDATFEVLQSLALNTFAYYNLAPERVAALATMREKCQEPGLTQLARHYHWPLLGFNREQLDAQRAGITQSSTAAERYMQVASVAEAAALAGCQQLINGTVARLLGARHQNHQATAALAGNIT
ncbi:cobalamin biosynthesis protein [Kushneria phosphatilytica]|uniref:Cobalamin biosynthesis protein n=1 Tax=Kushneria phosphatilytica TaxID=657387 RepID=A0A1S1NWD4_9GAMM|nr:cobalamin biosynthesis protein [Kushneria phosphatilytica]OHV11872.1 hypothetical protein BH688_04070 [Kushneria phosphatilytica]QEL11045.1 cobalamin biosynthesis protein [Kushneria phosphatilytica]